MLVVAFDGLLFDTLPRRAEAVVEAFRQVEFETTVDAVSPLLPGRSITEVVREIVNRQAIANPQAPALDETAFDLTVLHAQRLLAGFESSGGLLKVAFSEKLRRAASVTRVVFRSDSGRREVDALLRLTELDTLPAMTRCSDDATVEHRSEASDSTLRRSYGQIVRRMAANRNLLGNASGIGVAFEVCEAGREVAREFGFQAPEHVDFPVIPGL